MQPNRASSSWEALASVALGVAGLVVVFAIATWAWSGSDRLAAIGAIASPIVAVVSAYFGIRVSQSSAEQMGAAKTEADLAKLGALESNAMSALTTQAQQPPAADPDAAAAEAWEEVKRKSGL
jgi:hypothetical protein